MAYFLGKSGADAVYKALHHICTVINRFSSKLHAAIDAAESGGVITSSQASAAHVFVDGAHVTCEIFKLIASNSGYN